MVKYDYAKLSIQCCVKQFKTEFEFGLNQLCKASLAKSRSIAPQLAQEGKSEELLLQEGTSVKTISESERKK